MASNNKRISVSELDFDNIKANLKEYLKGQDAFSDYDFEGSGLSILLDVLAYNTHYNGIYTNLAINEMFIDSASKRSSVVSLAKSLGYTPNSATCASATVTLNITSPAPGPSVVIVPAYTQFNTTVDGNSYAFYTTQEYNVIGASTNYSIPNVVLTEGSPLTFKYTVAAGTRYIIPNVNVDLSTVKIRVQENSTSSNFLTYTISTSIITADSTSKVFWVKEIDDGLYELTFGNGTLGKALDNGNVVHISYFVSSLDAPNSASLFSYDGSTLYTGANVSITTTSPASGGGMVEDISSIKFNAPRSYAAQNRAVTPDDYRALIYANFPEAASVAVWGGEDNEPPVYGKTYISVKPKTAGKLTLEQKSNIINTILQTKNIVSITPEILDAEYINISLNVTVYYNDRETGYTPTDIASIVRQVILDYNNSDLQKFEGVFRYSKLSRLIDAAEPSITNNITTVLLRRKLSPRYNISAEYNINVINPIFTSGLPDDSVISTGFYIKGSEFIHYLTDDGVGNMVLYYRSAGTATQESQKIIVDATIGTVNYAAGKINIKNLNITGLADVDFEISIKPSSNDVISAYTQIAEITPDHLFVTAIPDKTANGDLRAGTNYTFTTSRS
jgi:hypothetical protein